MTTEQKADFPATLHAVDGSLVLVREQDIAAATERLRAEMQDEPRWVRLDRIAQQGRCAVYARLNLRVAGFAGRPATTQAAEVIAVQPHEVVGAFMAYRTERVSCGINEDMAEHVAASAAAILANRAAALADWCVQDEQ